MADFNVEFQNDDVTFDTGILYGIEIVVENQQNDTAFDTNILDDVEMEIRDQKDDTTFEADVFDGLEITVDDQYADLNARIRDLEKAKVTDEERESWGNKTRVYRNASGALVISR